MVEALFISALSPFGARLRLVLALTGETVAMEAPPDGAGSAAMRAMTPFGRVPALHTGTRVLVESAALMEYFAERAPETGLIPTDAQARAAMRAVILAFDHYVLGALLPALLQLRASPPDAAVVRAGLADTAAKMADLAGLLDADGFAIGPSPSLADCAIVPFASLIERLGGAFGAPSPFTGQPRWSAWWERVRTVQAVQQVLAFQAEALARAFPPQAQKHSQSEAAP